MGSLEPCPFLMKKGVPSRYIFIVVVLIKYHSTWFQMHNEGVAVTFIEVLLWLLIRLLFCYCCLECDNVCVGPPSSVCAMRLQNCYLTPIMPLITSEQQWTQLGKAELLPLCSSQVKNGTRVRRKTMGDSLNIFLWVQERCDFADSPPLIMPPPPPWLLPCWVPRSSRVVWGNLVGRGSRLLDMVKNPISYMETFHGVPVMYESGSLSSVTLPCSVFSSGPSGSALDFVPAEIAFLSCDKGRATMAFILK